MIRLPLLPPPAALIPVCLLAAVAAAATVTARLHVPTHYHVPTPLLTMLSFSPPSALSTALKQSSTGGLTYDPCTLKTRCASGRTCLDPKSSFSACTGAASCVCLPAVPPLCFVSSDCGQGEVCADAPIAESALCVSSKAAARQDEIMLITVSPGGGRTLDSCDKDADCVGGRKCTFFGDEFRKCDRDTNCACLPDKPLFCVKNGDCPRGELCAKTPFTERPFCVSTKSEKAYAGVNKLPDASSCPVRIKRDRPLKSLSPPGRTNVAPTVRRKTARVWMRDAAAGRLGVVGRFGMDAGDGFDIGGVDRIVGGQFASKHLRRYMVAIYKGNFTSLCSGTLLSPRWVLTAAHCNVPVTATVALGASRAFRDGTLFSIKRVFNHPKYSQSSEGRQFDLAVLEIEGGALKQSKFMELNNDPKLPKPGTFVRDIGFGANSFERKLPDENPLTLRQVDVPVTTFEQCNKAYQKIKQSISQRRQFCAGYPQGNCGACQGDSGAPVIQYNKFQKPVIMGVVSFGVRCALPGFPTVYTRVDALIRWLRTTPAVFYTSKGVFGNRECKPGEFLFSFTKQVKFCRECPSSQTSGGGADAKCVSCGSGLTRSKSNGSQCICGEVGKGIVGGACKKCPPGQFSAAENTVCKPCPPGSFSSKAGAGSCTRCQAKFFAPKAGGTECIKCPTGTTSTRGGASKCV